MDRRTKILVGVAITLLLTGAGVSALFLFKQHTNGNSSGGANLGLNKQPNTDSSTQPPADTETPEQQAYDIANYGTTGEVPSTWSQVETGFDNLYNYQKRDGTWWTAKKSAPTNWVTLADPKYASSVAKLNAAYPND